MEGTSECGKPAQTGQHWQHPAHDSRRAWTRAHLHHPVQLGLGSGRVVCARINHLSPDGIQVRCDPDTALAVNPAGRALEPGNGPEVLVAIRLHEGQTMRTHVIRCRVSYVLPPSPGGVVIGLGFGELQAAQRDAIDAALGARFAPPGD